MDHEQRAERIRAQLRAEAQRINDSGDLSDTGRRRQLAAAYTRARTEMDKVKRDLTASRRARRDQLQRELFGAVRTDPTSIVSHRDALDRADRIKSPEEAHSLLARARLSGDEALAQAAALRALDCARSGGVMGHAKWGPVLDAWAAGDPRKDALLTELGEVERGLSGGDPLFAYTVTRPVGLGVGDNVQRLAREADAADDAPTRRAHVGPVG